MSTCLLHNINYEHAVISEHRIITGSGTDFDT